MSAVAKRYALALFQLAKENNQLDQYENELREVKKALADNDNFKNLLKLPKLPSEKKKEILKEVFSKTSTYVLNTLMLLCDAHREEEMEAVAASFIELVNEERGIAEAVVYSIRPLTASESEAISSAFAKKVGKTSLNIENVIDSNILGGVKVRIGNRIFDGSLQGKLNRLKRDLIS
ncbi:F0F1 ATP synthase subunit delta [Heyndrickxia camelliae]|uniref:ATP synthase subunit delta n=1 Tax=Heyndrickxia camelliae TaxID=1707093 RepID=A0A2N3LF14_9BACI|nr:F0F1 ATP synthase subunit delta [Heyndrickxia camelliae]PKR83206.1 F0F1 ATP synthase subunit delta [Heyndrickxia camelliae]